MVNNFERFMGAKLFHVFLKYFFHLSFIASKFWGLFKKKGVIRNGLEKDY